ncbi:MAG: methyltransferase family protein [Saprospiraceae bacterium]
MKILLLAYILLIVGLTFVLPSYRIYRKTGINPLTFSNTDSAHDFIGRLFKIIFAGLILSGAAQVLGRETARNWLFPLSLPSWSATAGAAVLFAALAWVSIAQIHMADSWRIGIDEKNDTALITHGLFGLSRNPIFLGMQATLAGLFLVMPNLLTLVALALGLALVQIQVRLEEEFLKKKHGAAYAAYCQKVRRWL